MPIQVLTKLCLTTSTHAFEVSSAIAMGLSNSAQATIVVDQLDSQDAVLSVSFQASNDRKNWTDLGADVSITKPGVYLLETIQGIEAAYVRFHASLEESGGNTARVVMAMSVNLTRL